MSAFRGFFGLSGLMFLAGIGTAAEFFIGGGKTHLAMGQRTSLADLAEPGTAVAQVTEPALAAEVNMDEQPVASVHKVDAAARVHAAGDEAPSSQSHDQSASSDELAALRDEKRTLQLQQQYLLEQVVKYKRQALALQQSGNTLQPSAAQTAADVTGSSRAKDQDPLQRELDKERIHGRDLERQIEDLKKHDFNSGRDREEAESLQLRLNAADAETKRLTALLEEQRGTSSDNSYMRKELTTSKTRITELEKQLDDDKQAEKRASELQRQVEALSDQTHKGDADLKKVADFAVGLKKDLQDQKTIVAVRDEEIQQLKDDLGKAKIKMTESAAQDAELKHLQDLQGSLTEQLGDERKRRTDLEQGLGDAREALKKLQTERDSIQGESAARQQSVESTQQELDDTKRQLSKASEDARSCQQDSADKGKQLGRLKDLESALKDARTELDQKQQQIAVLTSKNQDEEELISRLPELRRELVATKNQVVMKDQEIEMLSKKSGAERSTQPAAIQPPPARSAVNSEAIDRHMEESGRRAGVETIRGRKAPPVADAMIVEVLVPRAALRSGPSPDDSEVMSISQGSRLTVEERKGDWYRVIAPNSTRAYVRADLVRPVSGDSAPVVSPAPGIADAPETTVARAPRKRPLHVGAPSSDMVPFGDVKGAPQTTAQDSIDRAFEKIRSGVGSKPMTPELMPNQQDPTE